MPDPYVLSLDVGTTAIKVGLFSTDGTLLRVATREQTLTFIPPDRFEQSPDGGWSLIVSAVREVMSGIDGDRLAAISVSNHRGTAIALDAHGQPLSEFVVWMDKRGLPYVDWLLANIGAEIYYNACGHPIVSYTGVSKLLWFRDSQYWDDARVIAPPQTYFLAKLGCHDLVCDVSTGSFLFPNDIDRQTWSTSLAEQIGFPLEKLPRLVNATDIVGQLSAAAAAELGLRPGVPLVAGGGDGQCAGAGSGVIVAGRALVNIGTAAGVQVFLPKSARDPAMTLNCAAHVMAGSWEMEGHTQASGAVFRWFRDTFGTNTRESSDDAYNLLVAEAASAPPGADGLLFIPTFNGSSAPVVDLSARGTLLGLTLAHDRARIIRALLEGISLELRWMLDAITALSGGIETVYLSGGGARNPLWNQIHANVLNRPITTLRVTDAAMVGAAMCAAVGIGHLTWDEAAARFVRAADIIEPQSSTRQQYAELYSAYKEAFTVLSMSGIFKRLQKGTLHD